MTGKCKMYHPIIYPNKLDNKKGPKLCLKGDHSKKLTFLCHCLWEVNVQLLHSQKFQPLKCLLSWRNSSWNKPLWRLLFWNSLGSLSKLMERRKTWNWLGISFKRAAKSIFSKQLSTSLYLSCYHFGVWSMFSYK